MKKQVQLLISLLVIVSLTTYFNRIQSTQNQEGSFKSVWQQWQLSHNITYKTQEQKIYRQSIFGQNLQSIQSHNSKLGKKYEKGLNLFADLTQQQFENMYLSLMPKQQYKNTEKIIKDEQQQIIDVDWVEKGAVSPVKNSGAMCSGTYSWSALGAIEGISAVTKGSLTLYSWQQIIECSQQFGNQGCQGSVKNAMNYVANRGINTDKQYPSIGVIGSCKNQSGSFKIKDFQSLTNCEQISNSLQKSPISVYVDASNFSFYRSGIFQNCGTNLNIAVVLVGMTSDYWKIKLNWGTSWGEQGYIRLAQGNTCGVCLLGTAVNL